MVLKDQVPPISTSSRTTCLTRRLPRYQEFDLRFQWRISAGGNSGVKYFVLEERGVRVSATV